MNFGDILKHFREGRGLSQAELSRRMGKDRAPISMYESGRRIPKLETMAQFADALKVNRLVFLLDKDYGKYFMQQRKLRNISESDVANFIDVPLDMYRSFENGDILLPVPAYEKLDDLIFCSDFLSFEQRTSERYGPITLQIMETCKVLNDNGKTMVLSYAQDISQIPKYIDSAEDGKDNGKS